MRMIKGIKRFIAVMMTAVFILSDTYIVNAEGITSVEDITEDITDTEEVTDQTVQDNTDNESDNTGSTYDIDEDISLSSDMPDDEIIMESIDDELVSEPEYEDLTMTSSMTLTKDMTVNNLNISDNVTLDLNGYTLNVKGDFNQNHGKLHFNNGQINCENNVTFSYGAEIHMEHVNDYLSVKGNLELKGSNNKFISSGTVCLYGDFNAVSSFNATDNNKFIFAGDKRQTININSDSSFNILEFRNFSSEGIYINYDLKYNTLIDNNCIVEYNDMGGERGYTLEEDTEIDGMYYLVIGRLDLNGHTLTINGDLIQGGGEIYINGGNLIVNGDYTVAKLIRTVDDEDNITYKYESGSGTFTMDNSEDYICVSGSYINNLNSNIKTNVNLTEGIMDIKGDLDAKYFKASKNHSIKLSGEEKQTVKLTDLSTYYQSNINNLILDRPL